MYGKMSINVRFQEINKQIHRSVLKIIHSYAAWLWLTFHHIGARLNEAPLLLPRLSSPLSLLGRSNKRPRPEIVNHSNVKPQDTLLSPLPLQSTGHTTQTPRCTCSSIQAKDFFYWWVRLGYH